MKMASIVEPIEGSARAYDTSALLDSAGREIARYRRMHIRDAESATIEPGAELGLAETPIGTVGMTSGHDLQFSDLYRRLTLAGASMIFHAGEYDERRLQKRAVENGVFLFAEGIVVDPGGAIYREHPPKVPRPSKGHGKALSFYEFGPTALFASRSDQRFSYCLYVPIDYDEDAETRYPLVVVVHGTTRTAQTYRDEFAAFAERHGCIVLAPLFPGGVEEPGDLDNYKRIEYRGIRFDHVLLDMVDEVSEKYRTEPERFLLHGFSGGGHFAHRFFYLHPDRLLGISIGAPGMITLIDPERPWWLGTADLEERFGVPLRLDEMRKVAVQMVIGGEDTDTWEINDHDSPRWVDGADAAGRTRLERLAALRENYEQAGIPVRHDVVPGVAHDGYDLLEPVRNFFADTLAGHPTVV